MWIWDKKKLSKNVNRAQQMLNFGTSKPRDGGGPGSPSPPPLDPRLTVSGENWKSSLKVSYTNSYKTYYFKDFLSMTTSFVWVQPKATIFSWSCLSFQCLWIVWYAVCILTKRPRQHGKILIPHTSHDSATEVMSDPFGKEYFAHFLPPANEVAGR